MTFQEPHYLWLLLMIVPIVLLGHVLQRRRDKRLAEFAEKDTWKLLNPNVSRSARRWRSVLLLLAIIFSIVTAARPLWGTRERKVQERGIDVIVAVDVSTSMLAADIEPNRLEQAKMRFRELLARFPGHRIGIMPFAGDAFLQCPLTSDYGIAMDVLSNLDTEVISTPGTNLARAITVARRAFDQGSIGTKVLLLITDGENHEEGLEKEIEEAAKDGIRIYCLGIGSPEGAPIYNQNGEIYEDKNGHKVLSKLDLETLKSVSEMTNGKAYVARPGEKIDLKPMIADLDDLEMGLQSDTSSMRITKEERYQIPLLLTLILFLIEAFIGERRNTIHRYTTKAIPAIVVFLSLVLPKNTMALDIRDDYKRLVDDGIVAYNEQDYEAARKIFQDALLLQPDGKEALMNLALTEARIENYDEASDRFKHVTDISDEDPEVKSNAYYNMARAKYDQAQKAFQEKNIEESLKLAMDSVQYSNLAIESTLDSTEDLEFNRAQAQHLIQTLAQIPKQDNQENSKNNEKQDNNESDDQNQSESSSEKNDESNDQDQENKQNESSNEQQSENNNDSGSNNENQESNSDKSDTNEEKTDNENSDKQQTSEEELEKKTGDKNNDTETDAETSQGEETNAEGDQPNAEMSVQEAENLLNMLDDHEFLIMRQPRRSMINMPEKDW